MCDERVIKLPFIHIGLRQTNFIPPVYFVWVKPLHRLTRGEVRKLMRWWSRLRPRADLFINVDRERPEAMRFAGHFGFVEVAQQDNISVQVWRG